MKKHVQMTPWRQKPRLVHVDEIRQVRPHDSGCILVLSKNQQLTVEESYGEVCTLLAEL